MDTTAIYLFAWNPFNHTYAVFFEDGTYRTFASQKRARELRPEGELIHLKAVAG